MFFVISLVEKTKGNIMENDDKNLFMVVNIEKSKWHPNYAWVSFANLQGDLFSKHWTDLSKNEQIKYGTIGAFDKNREFCGTQDYFDLENRYSVGQVMSVEHCKVHSAPAYKYHMGLANGDFETSFVESSAQLATVGNRLLIRYEKYIMNLTTMENSWNLLNHYNIRKYGLWPSYCGLSAKKYCPTADNKEYKNYKGETVMPAVVSKHYGDDSFCVFKPVPRPENCWHVVHILIRGNWYPLPRPSDVVLLEQTEEKDKFVLKDNLTMAAQLRDMQNKFGLPQHQAAMIELWQKTFGERE